MSDVSDLHPRVRRRMSRAFLLALVCVLVGVPLMAACSDNGVNVSEGRSPQDDGAVPPEVAIRELVRSQRDSEPPTINVFGEGAALELSAWTTCWANYCADGWRGPEDELQQVRGAGPLYVEFPVDGWEFSASTQLVGEECGRVQTEPLARVAPTVHELVPQGFADQYVVDVFGRGPGGDVITSFVWETTVEGVLEVPKARVTVLADHDGQVDSYGVSLDVTGLAASPDEASATVTVTAAGGASTELYLGDRPYQCPSGAGAVVEGHIYLRAPLDDGLRAAALGDAPFTYRVELSLDGSIHEAVASWPTDEDERCRPCVPLSFEPALPALTPAGPRESV